MAPGSDHWQAIERIFAEAVTRPPEQREAYLVEACGDDVALLTEIQALLVADQRNQRLSGLAAAVASDWLSDGSAGDLIGRDLGPYQVQSSLAAGGMGHVYAARDSTLDRQVAIKVLPLAFARDPARVRRFENEARVIAALNHPHIVTIFQIGNVDDRLYLATELVEGETLRARIRRGAVPLDEALELALQIASALVAAHGAGIVHRDLKPENVMVRPDGYVKVLDFGLAKQRQTAIELSMATLTGAVMGTVDYMSPEQALGQEVDHRTDIFGAGVLLYELITGTVPFRGRTDTETRARLESVCGASPAGEAVVRLVLRALSKDPEQRFSSAVELRDALRHAATLIAPAPAIAAAARGWWRAAAAGAAITVIAAGAVAALLAARRPAAPVTLDPWAAGHVEQLTDAPGPETWPTLAAGGRDVVYAAAPDGGDFNLYRLADGSRDPILLTPDSPGADIQPALSPDGARVAFRSDRDGGGIFVMELAGGGVRRVSDIGYHPAWSPDGRSLAVSGVSMERPESVYLLSELWIVDVATSGRRAVATRDAVQPAWSPSGQLIAFASIPDGGNWQRDIWVVPAAGGPAVRVTTEAAADFSPVWTAGGASLFFCSDRGGAMNLWQVGVNAASGEPAGRATPVTVPARYACPVAMAADGSALAFVSATARSAIARAPFDPVRGELTGPPVVLTPLSRSAGAADVSPDGRQVAFANEGDRQEDIYLMNLDGTGLRAVTSDAASDRMPRWSPDGRRLAFTSNRSGKSEIWTVAPDGGELRQLSTGPDNVNVNVGVFAPDGRMSVHEGPNTYIINPTLPYTGQAKDVLPSYSFSGYRFSPDLRFLWGWQRLAGGPYPDGVVRYDIAGRRHEALTNIGTVPFPLADGRRVLFTHIRELFMLDSQTRQTRKLDTHRLIVSNAVLSPDQRTIVLTVRYEESDLWRLTPVAATGQ